MSRIKILCVLVLLVALVGLSTCAVEEQVDDDTSNAPAVDKSEEDFDWHNLQYEDDSYEDDGRNETYDYSQEITGSGEHYGVAWDEDEADKKNSSQGAGTDGNVEETTPGRAVITITVPKIPEDVSNDIAAQKVPEVAAAEKKLDGEDAEDDDGDYDDDGETPEKKEAFTEEDYDWPEDEGDSDDGMGGDGDKPVAQEQDQEKLALPTDNDLDSDKYFDPEGYQDKILLHNINDLVNQEWTVLYEDTRLPCIMFRGAVKLIVPTNPVWYNKDFVEIDVPYDAVASGTCGSVRDFQELTLKWNVSVPQRNAVYENSVTFSFATNWTSEYSDELLVPEDKYAVVKINVVYFNGEINEQGDGGLVSYTVGELAQFLTPFNMSMSCLRDTNVILGSMQLTLSNVLIEAFRPNTETLTFGEFSRADMCPSDEVLVFDSVMTFVIWGWIGALIVVMFFFMVLLVFGLRRRCAQHEEGGFGYKILTP